MVHFFLSFVYWIPRFFCLVAVPIGCYSFKVSSHDVYPSFFSPAVGCCIPFKGFYPLLWVFAFFPREGFRTYQSSFSISSCIHSCKRTHELSELFSIHGFVFVFVFKYSERAPIW